LCHITLYYYVMMTKSSATERIRRINAAMTILRGHGSTSKAITVLMERYKVSRRQAYRYIREAVGADRPLPLPERKTVFTVKLPENLVRRLREFAQRAGRSLSDLTAEALDVFLRRG